MQSWRTFEVYNVLTRPHESRLRTKLNDAGKGTYKLSVNDFIVKASALALRKVPAVNSSWGDDAIRRLKNLCPVSNRQLRFNYVDINVAVNTEKGLFTPLIKDADKTGLASIANTVKELAELAKTNKIAPAQLAVCANDYPTQPSSGWHIHHFQPWNVWNLSLCCCD